MNELFEPLIAAPPASFVYFFQRGEEGPIKIGKADDVPFRARGIQTATPEKIGK